MSTSNFLQVEKMRNFELNMKRPVRQALKNLEVI